MTAISKFWWQLQLNFDDYNLILMTASWGPQDVDEAAERFEEAVTHDDGRIGEGRASTKDHRYVATSVFIL